MFSRILVPVDLAHPQELEKALKIAADLARNYGVPICYVGVTEEAPSPIAHNPREFAQKLAAFAAEQAARHGIEASARAYPAHDPAVEITDILLRAVAEVGADLVVMASHKPNIADYILPSHGGGIATHTGISVFLVR